MLGHKTVLVLGAGASVAVGYPVGAELRNRLLNLLHPEFRKEIKDAGLLDVADELSDFLTTFEYSQMYSIDAFLARRPEFAKIGKRAVALVLLRCESADSLFRSKHHDLWYQYLFNAIAAESWNALDFSNLNIITFNYDRSLEQYLLVALMSAYGRNEAEALSKLRSLNILHIYGTLGAPWPDQSGYFAYGCGAMRSSVIAAAEMIKVIPEGRADDDVLLMAKDKLINASRIAFLGFGFDPTNLKRLESDETCREGLLLGSKKEFKKRLIVASCLGMTDAEITRAMDSTVRRKVPSWAPTMPLDPEGERTFIKADCLAVLRSTLVL